MNVTRIKSLRCAERHPTQLIVFKNICPIICWRGSRWSGPKTPGTSFLIREPARVIASYAKGREDFALSDLGYAAQRKLWEELGRPPVIDSMDILRWPRTMLSQLCHAIDIPFDNSMLSWEKGARETDGAWAPYWYKSVENSVDFSEPPETDPIVPPQYHDILKACEADYYAMEARKLTLKLA